MRQSDGFIKGTWRLAVATVILYCLLSFFFWSLMDVVTPFVAPALWLPVIGIAFVASLRAVILPFRHWGACRSASLLPLLFLITCFVITRFIDFTELWLSANFRFHLANREQVVRRIESGVLHSDVSHNASLIALSTEFASVSLGGGEVVVQRDGDNLMILFYTFRGVLDSFAGFVYTSDGLAPKSGDFASQFSIIRKVQDQWYYVSAH